MSSDRRALRVHVVPLPVLIGVWVALLVLTLLTVEAAGMHFGGLGIVIALSIAFVKATIVALYFMHLRYGRPFHAIAFVVALLFVFLFITFALVDTQETQRDMIPGYAPGLDEPGPPSAAG